ncbi:MAG: CDP-alcohol phosphatidyltransferase family protein [Candidatus Hodarchaeales archaeon]
MKKDKESLPYQRGYRKRYEEFFAPIGKKIDGWGVSANTLSFLNLIFSFFTAIAYFFSQDGAWIFIYLALLLMTVASLFDMVDGSVARAHKEKNPDIADGKFGAVLDPVLDRYGEAFIILGIMLSGYAPPDWVLFCFVGMIMASYVRARAESLGMTSCSVGVERKEKITLLALGSALEAIAFQLNEMGSIDLIQHYPMYNTIGGGSISLGPIALSVAIVAILSHLATYQRLKLSSEHL